MIMTLATVPVDVPKHIYTRLKNSATIAKRTVEDVLTSAVSIALPPSPDLPDDIADELAEMIWLSDEALWDQTNPTFTREQQDRLAELNHTNDQRTPTPDECEEQKTLLAAYERSVLLRAQAYNILSRRGHTIPRYPDLAIS